MPKLFVTSNIIFEKTQVMIDNVILLNNAFRNVKILEFLTPEFMEIKLLEIRTLSIFECKSYS